MLKQSFPPVIPSGANGLRSRRFVESRDPYPLPRRQREGSWQLGAFL
jgi:hypothetical protein